MTGTEGENLAAAFLTKKGYRLLERNYRTSFGEIDMIAQEAETLVFVEVKARSTRGFGLPYEAVDRRKQGKMSRVALAYLSWKRIENCPCRFDVVSIINDAGHIEITLFRNAFEWVCESSCR